MAFDYGPLATVAREQITNFGRSLTFTILDDTATDPSKPWKGKADPRAGATTETADGVFVEPESAELLGIIFKDEEMLKRAESILIMAPPAGSSFDYDATDEVTDGGEVFGVIDVRKLQPGPTTLLYYMAVKR